MLIAEETTFGMIAKNNPEDLKELMNQPEIQVIATIAKPLGDMSDKWMKKKTEVLLEVMKEIRPSLASTITETPGGMDWFSGSLIELKNILFGVTH